MHANRLMQNVYRKKLLAFTIGLMNEYKKEHRVLFRRRLIISQISQIRSSPQEIKILYADWGAITETGSVWQRYFPLSVLTGGIE